MDYGKSLPLASSSFAVGGLSIAGQWLVLGSLAFVAIAAVTIRFTFRRGRSAIQP